MPLADLLMERFKVRTRPVVNPEALAAATTTAQMFLGNNPNRLGFLVINLGEQICYIGPDPEIAAATRGIRLDASGGGYVGIWDEDFDMTAWAWWILSAADTSAIYVIEIVEY